MRSIAQLVRKQFGGRDIALVTANFGGIDSVKALPDHPRIDAFYYTDDTGLNSASHDAVRTWNAVMNPKERIELTPRLRSRYFKHQLHRLKEVRFHRWLIWADSSFVFKEFRFIDDIVARLERLTPKERLMFVPHPNRKTVREEMDYVDAQIEAGNEYLRLRYGQDKRMQALADLTREGFDLQNKLWCGGFWIVENNSAVRGAFDAWWAYTLQYGTQDQYFLPIAMQRFGLQPQALDVNIYGNEHFDYVSHPNPV